MWFYLYILASKKRPARGLLEDREFEREKKMWCMWKCDMKRFLLNDHWRVSRVVHILVEWLSLKKRDNRPSSSLKLDEAWTVDGPPKNMIEQTIKKRVVKQSANERAMVKTIREWNLLVVWIWSDGTNDERARLCVCVKATTRENKLNRCEESRLRFIPKVRLRVNESEQITRESPRSLREELLIGCKNTFFVCFS